MRVFMQTGQTGVAAAGATPLDQYSKTGAAEGEEAAEEEEKPLDFDEVIIGVEINQCLGCTREFFTKSFLGDDAAALARSSGEERAPCFSKTLINWWIVTGSC